MRRPNLFRAVMSLIVVLVLFGVYSVAIVPVIEPAIADHSPAITSDTQRAAPTSDFTKSLVKLFPADAWEAISPRILRDEKRKTALLFKTYEIGSDGGVRISPCTVIYGSADRDGDGSEKAPMVMQARAGATIYFDEPIDLSTAQGGNLVSGQLRGNVRIHRAADSFGRGKLIIETSNVQITSEGLMTPNDFTFEYEKSYGSGRDLIIRVDKVRSGKKPSFDIVQTIELVTLRKLYLNPETADPLGGSSTNGDSTKEKTPTQVTCKGPCRIDFRRNTLSFEEDVDLRRLNPDSAADVLQCSLLTIFFAKKPSDGNVVDDSRRMPDFQVQRVLAIGNPVVLNAPSRFAYLRGSRLEYDMATRKFRMTSATQSSFRHVDENAEHRLIAPQVQYEATEFDEIGSLFANGPGEYDGVDIEKNRKLSLKWKTELSLKRVEHFHLLAVDGNVDAQLDDAGHVEAGHVDIWLEPSPKQPGFADPSGSDVSRISLRPHRIEATGQVNFDSSKLTAQCARLETKFIHRLTSDPLGSSGQNGARVHNVGMQRQNDLDRTRFTSDGPTDRSPESGSPSGRPSGNRSSDEPSGGNRSDDAEANPRSSDTNRDIARPDRKVQLTGSTIELALTMTGPRIQTIDQIDVKGNARFRELPTVGSQTQPLAVDANAFRLNNPDAMNAFVQAVGEPTVISTGGFEIKATNVQLDKEKNLVWSNGSGTATIPIQQDFQGKPLDAPTQATVTWSRSMEFDGVLIKLHGDAIVKGPDFRLQSEHLQARLNRRIDFSAKQSGKPDVEQITAQDKVVAIYETREFGRLMSSSFMRVPNITLNTTNGDVAVDGAGQIMMTKRGFNASNQLVSSGKTKSAQVATNQEPPDDRLTFLQIDFQSDIRGNLEQRVLEFNRKVRAIYGPVYEWNQKINPNANPQEDDILLSCDKLVVAQGRPDSNDFRPFDMRATGNVFVEGQAFQATGERVTYDQSKDMLILRGNGQTDARIQYRRDERGGTIDKSAKEFKFYPGKREAEFNEFQSLEFRTIGR